MHSVIHNNTNALLSSAGCTLPQKKSLKLLVKNLFQKNSSILNELSVGSNITVKKQSEKYGKHLGNVDLLEHVNRKTLRVGKKFSKNKENVIAYDLSDIAKPYAKVMEGNSEIFDGSEGKTVNGYLLSGVGINGMLVRLDVCNSGKNELSSATRL